jgi:hypothetical protein
LPTETVCADHRVCGACRTTRGPAAQAGLWRAAREGCRGPPSRAIIMLTRLAVRNCRWLEDVDVPLGSGQLNAGRIGQGSASAGGVVVLNAVGDK